MDPALHLFLYAGHEIGGPTFHFSLDRSPAALSHSSPPGVLPGSPGSGVWLDGKFTIGGEKKGASWRPQALSKVVLQPV